MNTKRLVCLLLAVVMAAALFAGCGGQKDGGKDGRISISMYMCERAVLKELSAWLEGKFPNIDLAFIRSCDTI